MLNRMSWRLCRRLLMVMVGVIVTLGLMGSGANVNASGSTLAPAETYGTDNHAPPGLTMLPCERHSGHVPEWVTIGPPQRHIQLDNCDVDNDGLRNQKVFVVIDGVQHLAIEVWEAKKFVSLVHQQPPGHLFVDVALPGHNHDIYRMKVEGGMVFQTIVRAGTLDPVAYVAVNPALATDPLGGGGFAGRTWGWTSFIA